MTNWGKLKLLTAAIVLINTANAHAVSPDRVQFAWSVESGNVAQVQEWFKNGLNPNYEGNLIGPGLLIAAWNGNIDMMKLFIEHGANINQKNRHGETALALAAWNGHKKAIDWLLSNGAELNRPDKSWGALHYATFNGHTELVKHLISLGADVNARVPNGATAIMLAAREGRTDVAKLLLENGASLKYKSDWNDTAVTMAVRNNHLTLAKMVSTQEEFVQAIDNVKYTPSARSTAAPTPISELIEKIRRANVDNMPTGALQAQLNSLIREQKKMQGRETSVETNVKAVEITAKRGSPATGERVMIITK